MPTGGTRLCTVNLDALSPPGLSEPCLLAWRSCSTSEGRIPSCTSVRRELPASRSSTLVGRRRAYFAQLSDEHELAPVLSARAAFLYSSDL